VGIYLCIFSGVSGVVSASGDYFPVVCQISAYRFEWSNW
jgi:hypothetical protein